MPWKETRADGFICIALVSQRQLAISHEPWIYQRWRPRTSMEEDTNTLGLLQRMGHERTVADDHSV
jgi:hypothetical protein